MGEPKIELGAVWVHKASGRRFVVNGVEGTTNLRTGEFAHEPGERIGLLREDGLFVDIDAKHRAIFAPMPERGQMWKSKSDQSVVKVVDEQDGRVNWAVNWAIQGADGLKRILCSTTLADFVVTFEPVTPGVKAQAVSQFAPDTHPGGYCTAPEQEDPVAKARAHNEAIRAEAMRIEREGRPMLMGDEKRADAAYQGHAKGSPRTLFDVGAYVPLMSGWDDLDAKLRDPTGPDALPPFTLRTPKPAEPSPCITCGAPAAEAYCDPCERYHAADFDEPTLATVNDHEEECSLRITPNCTRWLGVGVLAAWWDDEMASCLACAEKKIRDSDAAYDDMYAGIEARRKAHGWVEP